MINRARIPAAVFLLLFISVGGYYVYQNSGNVQGDDTVDACNSYAFKLYGLYGESGENVIFSPYSISTCMSMVYEGACGETAKEMQHVFGWVKTDTRRLSSNRYLYDRLNDPKSECEVSNANALWVQDGFPFEEDYIGVVEEGYGGDATAVNFARSVETREVINTWVENRTKGKIQDLLSREMIHADVRFVLTNAVYFKGDWVNEFNPARTREAPFYLIDGSSVTAEMMYIKDTSFNYTETADVQVVELPYKGGRYSMVIVLPKENNLDEVEKGVTVENYFRWLSAMNEEELVLSVPKYKLENKYDMKEDLIEMGMPLAFTPEADLTKLSSVQGLFIENVVHQAYVEVNEKGTEAGAATGASGTLSIPKGVRFIVDHPFLFTIMDRETGLILFLGRVMDPSQNQQNGSEG